MCGVLLAWTSSAIAENIQKRAAALLTRAADASSYEMGHQPSFRETVRFLVRGVEGEAEGQYTRDFADAKQQREEVVIGRFRELWVWRNGQIWNKKQGEFDAATIEKLRISLPPRRVIELLPLDKVNKIESQDINGVKAQCISFDRALPQKHIANTVCVEGERGVLLSWSRGGLATEYSEYAAFASKLLPGRIVVSENQMRLLDANIDFTAIKDFSADTFALPPGIKAEVAVQACTQVQGPKLKTQYPPSYPSGARARGVVGVVTVVAEIGKDGHVHNAHVAQPGDGELDAAAVDAVQRWVYEPGTCNGSPIAVHTSIAVNFNTH
jgi:TonB family protein